jgi:uncharacterized protein
MAVGVSLDGPPAVHEQQRGMAAETLRGLKLLEREGIPFRVTTVLTQTNVRVLDRLVLTLAGFACAGGIGLDLLVNKLFFLSCLRSGKHGGKSGRENLSLRPDPGR